MLTTDDVALTVSLCFRVRYSTVVMATVSGSGLTVTEVNSGTELTPTLFVATTEKVSVMPGAPSGRVGVKLTVFNPQGVIRRMSGVHSTHTGEKQESRAVCRLIR